MKYLMTSLQIVMTNSANPQKYVKASLFNEDDPFDNPSNLPTTCLFGEGIVRIYEQAIANAQGDVTKIPDNLKYFCNAKFVDVPLPAPMHRIYGSDFKDSKGVLHKGGDCICDKNGTPMLYNTVRVLCKETIDNETGERRWANGWDPVSRGNNYISAFFIAQSTPSTSTETAPPAQQAPVIPPAQPIQAPVQAPIV